MRDLIPEGFASFDASLTILDVNQETLRLDGRAREELVGRSHWEAFPGTEHSPLGDHYRKAAKERVPHSLEHFYAWPDGGTAVFWRDITDRKRLQPP